MVSALGMVKVLSAMSSQDTLVVLERSTFELPAALVESSEDPTSGGPLLCSLVTLRFPTSCGPLESERWERERPR